MEADDRILVGVVKTKRDLNIIQVERWYRIPQGKAPKGIDADYLAFFLSAKVAGGEAGIYHYASRAGMELARRKDLLPGKKPHPRDENWYHKIQLGELQHRTPPIVNKPQPYKFAFIYTTGDRFLSAKHIRDLYSTSDYFVDRIFHVLKDKGYKPRRTWERKPAEATATETIDRPEVEVLYPTYAQVRMIAERGEVVATTDPDDRPSSDAEEMIYLTPSESKQDVKSGAEAIQEAVKRLGGPKILDIPIELY